MGTIPLDPKLNIGITRTVEGFKSFRASVASQEEMHQETTDVNIFETHVIPDLENDEDETHSLSNIFD